jgi:ferritin-like metal-binding protein YciE
MATTPQNDTRQFLADWLGDMVAIESHIEEALDHQLTIDTKSTTGKQAIQHAHDTVRDSKKRAEAFRDSYGEAGGQSVVQKGTELLGKAAGIIDKVRKDTATKALRDDYTAGNLAVAAYVTLHTTAIALEDDAVANFAAQGLKTYSQLVMDINKALPQTVVEDLIHNDEVPVRDPNAGKIAAAKQYEVWATRDTD